MIQRDKCRRVVVKDFTRTYSMKSPEKTGFLFSAMQNFDLSQKCQQMPAQHVGHNSQLTIIHLVILPADPTVLHLQIQLKYRYHYSYFVSFFHLFQSNINVL